ATRRSTECSEEDETEGQDREAGQRRKRPAGRRRSVHPNPFGWAEDRRDVGVPKDDSGSGGVWTSITFPSQLAPPSVSTGRVDAGRPRWSSPEWSVVSRPAPDPRLVEPVDPPGVLGGDERGDPRRLGEGAGAIGDPACQHPGKPGPEVGRAEVV